MEITCVWEHNGNDTLLYAVEYIGAYSRGESLEFAVAKMPEEIAAYRRWTSERPLSDIRVSIVGEKRSTLAISDADSDVIFESERSVLTLNEYQDLKRLALKSAWDFLTLYKSIPDKNAFLLVQRETFYGQAPRSAQQMYEHTKNVNQYYFSEIEVNADNLGDILECRKRGFEAVEQKPDFLQNDVICGSYGEYWSLRKVLRRFIWHDRIHAKAMYRRTVRLFGKDAVANPFAFDFSHSC